MVCTDTKHLWFGGSPNVPGLYYFSGEANEGCRISARVPHPSQDRAAHVREHEASTLLLIRVTNSVRGQRRATNESGTRHAQRPRVGFIMIPPSYCLTTYIPIQSILSNSVANPLRNHESYAQED